jgi:D-alanyl-lipoteichoic acid acyltransferase DltB (MBOAT superfamily)
MLFNSLQYAVFLPCVVLLYFALPHRWRWVLLLAASYYFYMCWRVEYAALIVASTLVDYVAGLVMAGSARVAVRRGALALSLLTNLGLLFAFKYANFASESFRALFAAFDVFVDTPAFAFLLPVGISFYTFQTLSYTIDVYRGVRGPERHLGRFALYVAFFPQLVAGPIERSERLLPQFRERHRFDAARAADGAQLILWGLFKKLVVADNLAVYVEEVFSRPGAYHGAPVWLAAYFFAFQIYCDFSGYSDIAIGSARLMGFRLMDNFRQPYLARGIADFWRRWHISLSTWFRDYVYVPLGGSRTGPWRFGANVLAVFLVSGLWHGANWTFVFWGALHGLWYLGARVTARARERIAEALGLSRVPRLHALWQILVTFHFVTFAFLFFRADSIGSAWRLAGRLFTWEAGQPWRVALRAADFRAAVIAMACVLAVEALGAAKPEGARGPFAAFGRRTRWALVYATALGLLVFGRFASQAFIYFQF